MQSILFERQLCTALQSKTELAALLSDLRWCFDTPANTVIELVLFRLGVPELYPNFLNDIDLRSVKSTITTAGFTLDVLLSTGAEGTHRQEHGTGQGTIEGPLNWVPVADMVISVARAASTQPVQVPTGDGRPTPVSKSWYVDDSALMQAGKRAVDALNQMVNEMGLMYYFLGLERRAKKCLWVPPCWVNGALQRKAARPDEQLLCSEFLRRRNPVGWQPSWFWLGTIPAMRLGISQSAWGRIHRTVPITNRQDSS